MESLEITGTAGKYRLTLRDYMAQGVPPDYATLARLTDDEAALLQRSGFIKHLYGEKIDDGTAPQGAACPVTLIRGEFDEPTLAVRLPPIPALGRGALQTELPGWSDRLRAHSRVTLRALVARHGLAVDAGAQAFLAFQTADGPRVPAQAPKHAHAEAVWLGGGLPARR